MIYILIFLFSQYDKPSGVGAVEFNTLEACQAAAALMVKQMHAASDGISAPVVLCAAKGAKQGGA